jgi:hypothetical protein
MKKVALLLSLLLCVPVMAQQPITDGNGDGIVDLTDVANLAGDWLGAGYAGLETNARIDVGFYTGNASTQNTIQQVNHYLGRVPNFILVFSLSPTYDVIPAIILNDGSDTKIKFFNSRDCDVFPTLMTIDAEHFKVTNISESANYWLNKIDGRYFYIAVSQEVPAMALMEANSPEAADALLASVTQTEAIPAPAEISEDNAVEVEESERLCLFLEEIDEWISETTDPETLATLQEFKAELEQEIQAE